MVVYLLRWRRRRNEGGTEGGRREEGETRGRRDQGSIPIYKNDRTIGLPLAYISRSEILLVAVLRK
jgi:hypothetical protein